MKEPELATSDTNIQEALLEAEESSAKPAGSGINLLADPPSFIPDGAEKVKFKLYKNEDPEVKARYTGAKYEVYQFELWKPEDMAKYQSVMTEVGTDEFTAIIFQDRVFIKEQSSWKVLLEIAHYVQVIK